jgi:hypothetical protein
VTQEDTSDLETLLAPLPDSTRAEFLVELRKLSRHQDDELFKLLRILSHYAAFYQSVPAAIKAVHKQALSRLEAMLSNAGQRSHAADSDSQIARALERLSQCAEALRTYLLPPFEEFRSTVESLHANAPISVATAAR